MCMGRIPIFTSQLEKAREATDAANIRAAYAEATVEALDSDDATVTKTVEIRQKTAGWTDKTIDIAGVNVDTDPTLKTLVSGDTLKVTVKSDGTVAFSK